MTEAETRDLLELAAKAIGLPLVSWNDGGEPYSSGHGFILEDNRLWNPLLDDGDSLRLQLALPGCVSLSVDDVFAHAHWWYQKGAEMDLAREEAPHRGDKAAAARLVVLRAAAAIGRAMP